jgi:RNA polymerase subunit RPABC4/transcription elongation factor Spt4
VDACPDCGEPVGPLTAECGSCGSRLLVGAPDTTPPPEETAPCRECGREVAADATYCRHCGYTPRDWGLVAIGLQILGFLLTASFVGAVVGIPMQLLSLRLFRKDGTVTE